MTMMDIGVVRMPVLQGRVSVPVGVRPGEVDLGLVMVPVVLVVHVPMAVLQGLVLVLVVVSLGQVQPYPDTHEHGGKYEGWTQGLPQEE
jgi:hypothetical protein